MSEQLTTSQILTIVWKYLKKANIKISAFILPALLVLGASLFEGLSLSLLVPAIDGTINQDFSLLKNMPVISEIIRIFPEYLARGNTNLVIFLVLMIFCSATLKVALHYFSSLITTLICRRFVHALRMLVYKRLLSFGKLYFDQTNYGYLHQLITLYTVSASGTLGTLQSALYVISMLLVYLIIMLTISWQLTIIVILVFPLLHYSLRWLIDKIHKSSLDHTKAVTALGERLANSLTTIPLVKAYANEKEEEVKFSTVSSRVESLLFSIYKKSMLINPIQEIMSLCLLLAIVTIIVFFASYTGQGSLASYALFLLILRRSSVMFGVFNNTRSSLATSSGHILEVDRVFTNDNKFIIPDGKEQFKGLQKEIVIDKLNFIYPKGLCAIQDLSLKINKGQILAIVGHSGAGKSTLIHIIMRLYDIDPSSIFVDGTDIRDFSINSWLDKVALVSQDTLLFNDTIRNNISYGLQDNTSDEEIWKVIRTAKLEEYVQALPEGLDSQIGDRGIKLSGGEKQRLSIARAILKQAEILLLDEATSSLDSKTEKAIQEALEELVKNRTTIVIAHRLSTIKNADRIVVLDHGKLIEEGSLEELLARQGKFYEYWEEQKFS